MADIKVEVVATINRFLAGKHQKNKKILKKGQPAKAILKGQS
jgi:hypothetical protein